MFLTLGASLTLSLLSLHHISRTIYPVQCSRVRSAHPHRSFLFFFPLSSPFLWGVDLRKSREKKTRPDPTRLSGRGVAGFSLCVPFWRACLSLSLSSFSPPAATSSNKQQPQQQHHHPKSEIPLVFLLLDHLLLLARSSFSLLSPSLLPSSSLPPSLSVRPSKSLGHCLSIPGSGSSFPFPFLPFSPYLPLPVLKLRLFSFAAFSCSSIFPAPHFLFPEFSLPCPLLMPPGGLRSERQT